MLVPSTAETTSSILDIRVMMVKDFLGKDQNAGNITRKAIFPFSFYLEHL